mmetsp:Transcript_28627/g.27525  ORF Transcript_28627/g.27525 Transcript_28627/m.27525 type:complete len:135 (-) Transcript_28627:142-546(-)
MSAANNSIPPLHVLRGILRLIKAPVHSYEESSSEVIAAAATMIARTEGGQKETEYNLRQNILKQYREAQNLPSKDTQVLQKMALDFYTLRKDLRERSRLYALDAGVEVKLSPKEMSRRAAARAGLQLPDMSHNS